MLTVRARRLILLLAALTAVVLAGCAGVSTTPGGFGVGVQNRVWALQPATGSFVRLTAVESACSRQGSIRSAAGVASGFCVAAEDEAANTYIDLTKGSSIRNVGTDATPAEFAQTLRDEGFSSTTSADGRVEIFSKDGAKYVLRAQNSSNYPGYTADFTPAGGRKALELRLGHAP